MKNLIVSLAFVLTTGITPVFANNAGDDTRAEKALATQFVGAENVKWSKLDDGYQKAAFTLNGVRVEAFFNQDAELIGAIRNIFYNQVPLAVMQSVNNRFEGGVVLEVKEITGKDGTQYRIILGLKNKKYNVKLNSMGEIIELKKEKIKE